MRNSGTGRPRGRLQGADLHETSPDDGEPPRYVFRVTLTWDVPAFGEPTGPSLLREKAQGTPFPPLATPNTSASAPWSAASFRPGAPVELGFVGNPRARALREHDGQKLRDLRAAFSVDQCSRFHLTESLGALDGSLAELVRGGVNVLAVAGGDGTLHHTLNALAKLGGGTPWPGTVLVLRGGTLNIISRTLGPALDPAEALRTFVQSRVETGTALGALATKQVPLLSIDHADLGRRYGFIFGSEMVKNALEMYDQFGGGYSGLSRFMFEVARGFAFRGELWQKERWRLDPPTTGAELDDGAGTFSTPTYAAAIACAVDLVINGGVRAVRRAPHARGFYARVVTETRTTQLLKMIPSLMSEGHPAGVVDFAEATRLSVRGSYTIDGECFGASARERRGPAPSVVVSAEHTARFVAGATR